MTAAETPHRRFPGLGYVTPEIAAHVLWFTAGPEDARRGLEPGSFTRRLLEACAAADPQNLYNLQSGFPGYVAAFRCSREWTSGDAVLAELAGVLARVER